MKLKKSLSSLLALVLLIGGMTVTAQAETAPWADGTTPLSTQIFYTADEKVEPNISTMDSYNQAGSTYDTTTKKGIMVFTQEITAIPAGAFYEKNSLTSIILPSSVTSIGDMAFYNCPALTSISMPEVTSIGESSFWSCILLATINFSKVTSIDRSAFYMCQKLTSISLPEATSIGNGAFDSCSALKSVSMPKVTSIGTAAFLYCSELKYVCAPVSISETLKYESLYNLTFETTGGLVSVSGIEVPANCSLYIKAGTVVNLTASPYEGFKLDSILCMPNGGNTSNITDTKSFTMPYAAVKVKADFSINLDSETGSGQAAIDQYYTKSTTETTTNYKVGVSWTTETMEIEVNDAKIWDPVALAWKTNEDTAANNGVASLKDGSNARTFTFTNYSPAELKCNITFAVESTLSDKYTGFTVDGTDVVLAAVVEGENHTTNSTYLDENNNVDATKLPTASITCTVNPNLDGFKGADASASAAYGTYTITVGK